MNLPVGLLCLLFIPTVLVAVTTESRELIESGNSFYRMGLYEEAGKQYLRAAEVDRDSPEISYNLGNVYHQKFLEAKLAAVPGVNSDRRSDWEQKAVSAYKQALASDAPSLREKALFNLGNTYAEAERRVEAIAAYEEALRIIPNDEDAKHNLELLLKGKKIPAITRITEIPKTVPPLTNVVMATGTGSLHTNVVGKAQASGGSGSGNNASDQGQGAGSGDGAQQPGGGAWGTEAATPAQQSGAAADTTVLAATDTSVKAEASASGDKGDKIAAKAGANESSGGKTAEKLPGAGGHAATVEGKAGTASPDKATAKDKSATAQSDATRPKDQDKSANASSSDTLDPREQNVLDKASKSEQRYINQWTRPPDLKKPKDQDW